MVDFAIIAPPLRGHYAPLLCLATELIARGHKVTFMHQPDASSLVDFAGIGFEPIARLERPLSTWTEPMARMRGMFGLGPTLGGMVRFIDVICRDAPQALRRIGADALIVDQLEPAGALVAEHLGLPFVSVATALPINRESGVPPPYVGWDYDPTNRGLSRNRGGWRVTDLLLRKVYQAIERNARRLGLNPRRRLEDCLSPLLQLSQMVPSIDFPRRELPNTFHYTGPFRGGGPQWFDLPRPDGRPLVYCSLGSLQGSRLSVFRKVAEACLRLELRLLISHGGLAKDGLANLPGDPLVYDWVPQEAVLRQADLVICHGGMNTVLDALSAAVPMALIPLAFEQSATAARIQRARVGKAVSLRVSAGQLADVIAELRGKPVFRQRALEVQHEIQGAGGSARAADLIEQSLGVSVPKGGATKARTGPSDAHDGSRSESK